MYIIEVTCTDGSKIIQKWDDKKIKRAFNFKNGSVKDFMIYVNNNKTIKLLK